MTNRLEVTDNLEGSLREEVTFWQTFIRRYQNKGEPLVLSRAIESLNLAEDKLSIYQGVVLGSLLQIQPDTKH